MAEWLVKLDGHGFDLLELSSQLTSPELSVTQEGADFWLRATQFATLIDAGDVRAAAEKLLKWINGAGHITSGDFRPVRQAGVERRHEDGQRETFNFGQANIVLGRARAIATGVARGAPPQSQPALPSDITFAALQAEQDEAVQRVLRIYGGRNHDWVNLYRVFEIVQADAGNLPAKGWAAKSEIDRFKHTANSVGALGDDARHGVEHTQPPKRPMSLQEAQSLIRTSLKNWLNSKRPPP